MTRISKFFFIHIFKKLKNSRVSENKPRTSKNNCSWNFWKGHVETGPCLNTIIHVKQSGWLLPGVGLYSNKLLPKVSARQVHAPPVCRRRPWLDNQVSWALNRYFKLPPIKTLQPVKSTSQQPDLFWNHSIPAQPDFFRPSKAGWLYITTVILFMSTLNERSLMKMIFQV